MTMKQQTNERWIFVCTGAAIGRVHSEYRCEFWSDNPLPSPHHHKGSHAAQPAADPGFDPKKLTPIDLERTPMNSKQPSDVLVDDPTNQGGFSTLGPGFPAGRYLSNVYLEEKYRASLPPEQQPALPPNGTDGFDYEFTTVYYWPGTSDPRSGRRYVGVHAELRDSLPVRGQNRLAEVALFPRGQSKSQPPVLTTWIDLGSIDQVDPVGLGGLTKIDPDLLTIGPVYLESELAKKLLVLDIKIPAWKGL